jgi:hypothetical protein
MLTVEDENVESVTQDVNENEVPILANIDIANAINDFEEIGCETASKDCRKGGMPLEVGKAIAEHLGMMLPMNLTIEITIVVVW